MFPPIETVRLWALSLNEGDETYRQKVWEAKTLEEIDLLASNNIQECGWVNAVGLAEIIENCRK